MIMDTGEGYLLGIEGYNELRAGDTVPLLRKTNGTTVSRDIFILPRKWDGDVVATKQQIY